VLSDIEIANAATLRPIRDVAQETLGIEERHLVPYGHYKAKVDLSYLASLADRPLGRLCSAWRPTRTIRAGALTCEPPSSTV